MGPVSGYNMIIIAPAFYGAQVDISGPLKANSPHNKRATIKIWHVVFCCMTQHQLHQSKLWKITVQLHLYKPLHNMLLNWITPIYGNRLRKSTGERL